MTRRQPLPPNLLLLNFEATRKDGGKRKRGTGWFPFFGAHAADQYR